MSDVREGLAKCHYYMPEGVPTFREAWENLSEDKQKPFLDLATKQVRYLRSKGVVRKVEGELPPNRADVPIRPYSTDINTVQILCGVSNTYAQAQQDMIEAGYTLTEELIRDATVDEPHPADEMTTAKDVAW